MFVNQRIRAKMAGFVNLKVMATIASVNPVTKERTAIKVCHACCTNSLLRSFNSSDFRIHITRLTKNIQVSNLTNECSVSQTNDHELVSTSSRITAKVMLAYECIYS